MIRTNTEQDLKQKNEQKNLTFLQMSSSILASFFGVQSDKNRIRDFTHGKAWQFIAIGLLFTAIWYGAISLVVSYVLRNT